MWQRIVKDVRTIIQGFSGYFHIPDLACVRKGMIINLTLITISIKMA